MTPKLKRNKRETIVKTDFNSESFLDIKKERITRVKRIALVVT
jgi:hypothetical protein